MMCDSHQESLHCKIPAIAVQRSGHNKDVRLTPRIPALQDPGLCLRKPSWKGRTGTQKTPSPRCPPQNAKTWKDCPAWHAAQARPTLLSRSMAGTCVPKPPSGMTSVASPPLLPIPTLRQGLPTTHPERVGLCFPRHVGRGILEGSTNPPSRDE